MRKKLALVFLTLCLAAGCCCRKPCPCPPPPQPCPVDPESPRKVMEFHTKAGCAPCARMKGCLRDPLVVKALHCYDVKECPEGVGPLKVHAYPTLVILADGKEVSRIVGYHPPHDVVEWLEAHK